MTDKQIISTLNNLISELRDCYNEYSDYSKGYLDGLFELCQQLEIKAIRTELNLHIEQEDEYDTNN